VSTKRNRFLPQEIAEYLIGRMVPDGRKRPGNEKKTRRTIGAVAAPIISERVAGLTELALEGEDIVRQIVKDRALFQEGRNRSVTQNEILQTLDDMQDGDNSDLRALARAIRPIQGLESSAQEARNRLSEVKSKISDLMSDPATANAYRTHLTGKIGVIRAAQNVDSLQKVVEQVELARMELLARRNSENMTLTMADHAIIRKYDLIQQKAREMIDRSLSQDEVYYESKRRILLEYRRQLLSDGFVETPGVRKEVIKIISHLQLGIPVLLRGHLGAGKTEVALHVSRKYFGGEPEFISGSEEATKYDIYGRTQIGVRPEEEKVREFKSRMDEYLRMNPMAGKKEIKDMERQYYQTIVVRGLTTSFFQYGPLVRAMREGRPLVIDEMDGIPHSIIMRLNHVLTRRPGDMIKVQENGGEEIIVREGFCVLATGNIKSFRYKREELDAAFLSRWWSNDIIYPPQKETYEILVASLLDRRGNLQLSGVEDLDDLKRLTLAAAEIQKIFTGEQLDYLGEGADGARKIPASLKKSVLSLRHLWNVVRPWKAHNFDKPLENYILNEFIKPSVAEDRVYLLQLFCRFRFYKGWTADAFGIPGLTEAKLLAFQGKSAGAQVE
jgi:MoxR-like ATPase